MQAEWIGFAWRRAEKAIIIIREVGVLIHSDIVKNIATDEPMDAVK